MITQCPCTTHWLGEGDIAEKETDNYYAFGLQMAGIDDKAAGSLQNRNLFNGADELQSGEFSDGSGLELYDATFRMYDAQIGRFNQIDPLAVDAEDLSSYAFVSNNPILYCDPLGLADSLPKVAPKSNLPDAGPTVVVTSHKNSNKSPDNDVDLSTLGHNIFYTNYIGPWNPKDNNGDWTYVPIPVNRADAGAELHDKRYDSLHISGIKGVWFSFRAIPADEQLAKYELDLFGNLHNNATLKERIEGLITGEFIAFNILPKQITKTFPGNYSVHYRH